MDKLKILTEHQPLLGGKPPAGPARASRCRHTPLMPRLRREVIVAPTARKELSSRTQAEIFGADNLFKRIYYWLLLDALAACSGLVPLAMLASNRYAIKSQNPADAEI